MACYNTGPVFDIKWLNVVVHWVNLLSKAKQVNIMSSFTGIVSYIGEVSSTALIQGMIVNCMASVAKRSFWYFQV